MKGTVFSSKVNYHYNILLNKVSRSLALSLSKVAVFLEDLLLYFWVLTGGLDRNHKVWEDTDLGQVGWEEWEAGIRAQQWDRGAAQRPWVPSKAGWKLLCWPLFGRWAPHFTVTCTPITGRDEEHLKLAWDSALPCYGLRQVKGVETTKGVTSPLVSSNPFPWLRQECK